MPRSPFIPFSSGSYRRRWQRKVGFPTAAPVAAAVTAATLGIASLSGCSAADSYRAHLPVLSDLAQLREDIANADLAVAQAAKTDEQWASQCEDCANSLREVQEIAQNRVDLVGGQWQPWSEPSADLPMPDAAPQAPTLPSLLVSYMYQSAEEQLHRVTTIKDLDEDQRVLLASVLGGRLASAVTLAKMYPTNQFEALPPAAFENTATDSFSYADYAVQIQSDQDSDDAHSSQDPDQTEGADDASTDGEEGGDVGTKALLAYDCIATDFSRVFDKEGQESDNSLFFDRLTDRDALLNLRGISDRRPARCNLALTDDSAETSQKVQILMEKTVATDLSLIGSDQPKLRDLGTQFLIDDIRLWASRGGVNQVNPGLVESVDEANGSQSGS